MSTNLRQSIHRDKLVSQLRTISTAAGGTDGIQEQTPLSQIQMYEYIPEVDEVQIMDEAAAFEAFEAEKQEFYQRPVTVHCDLCSASARGTRAMLVACGWQFGRGSEFCPAEGN